MTNPVVCPGLDYHVVMGVSYIAPGNFRACLTVPGLPVATRYEHEVGESESPETALDTAVMNWRSGAWDGPIEHANTVQVFRHLGNGEVEATPSFLAYFRR
jgi:hypothetical protein